MGRMGYINLPERHRSKLNKRHHRFRLVVFFTFARFFLCFPEN